MLKLIVEKPEQVEATMPLRWCVGLDDLDCLKKAGVGKPYLLITIARDGEEVDRKLIPLERMMDYVQFHRPGRHFLAATIVWDRFGDSKRFLRHALEDTVYRHQGRWNASDHLDLDKDGGWWRIDDAFRVGNAELVVVVPDSFFAKKPMAWEWKWVNLWFESKPRDQCQFRRRRFLAYSIQPFAMFAFLVALTLLKIVVVASLLFAGMRNVHLRSIIHPFRHHLDDVWSDVKKGDSIFFQNKQGEERASFLFWPPLFFLYVAMAAAFFSFFPKLKPDLFKVLLASFAVPVLIVVVGSIVVVIVKAVKSQRGKMDADGERKKWEREKQEKAARKLLLQRQLDAEYARLSALTCERANLKAKVADLPKERQTVYLRFQDLKAKVCRPFAA